jgi:hypothetical protein
MKIDNTKEICRHFKVEVPKRFSEAYIVDEDSGIGTFQRVVEKWEPISLLENSIEADGFALMLIGLTRKGWIWDGERLEVVRKYYADSFSQAVHFYLEEYVADKQGEGRQ